MRRGSTVTLCGCCAVVAMAVSGAGWAAATPVSPAAQRTAGAETALTSKSIRTGGTPEPSPTPTGGPTLVPEPDLVVSAAVSVAPTLGGRPSTLEVDTYQATISNVGAQTATEVVFTITVPSDIRIGVATAPSGGVCSTSQPSDHMGGVVSCTLGSITVGDTIEVSVSLVPNAAGSAPIRASATEAETDANPANNNFALPFNSCQIDVLATHTAGITSGLPIYHTFIVYTAASESETGFRGGPTYPFAFYQGNIIATSGPYNSSFVDWAPGAPSVTAMVGSRACGKNSSFQASIALINSLHVPYRLLGPNSNTVTSTLLEDAQVPLVKPDLYTPGWDESL